MEFLSEFWLYMRTRKKFWLLPAVVALGLFGSLVALTKGTAVAPFIYALF
jgi:drug/metabolite transporter superfamily protein YnfA